MIDPKGREREVYRARDTHQQVPGRRGKDKTVNKKTPIVLVVDVTRRAWCMARSIS